jgi:hypothetical protein
MLTRSPSAIAGGVADWHAIRHTFGRDDAKKIQPLQFVAKRKLDFDSLIAARA